MSSPGDTKAEKEPAELYEWLARSVIEELVPLSLSKQGRKAKPAVWHRRKYLGKSGHSHEIDISFRFQVAGFSFLVLGECKRYSRKVEVADVLEFQSRLGDIGAQKGVMITTSGFQKGAARVAAHHGIALVRFSYGNFQILKGFGASRGFFEEPRFLLATERRSYERIGDLLLDFLTNEG